MDTEKIEEEVNELLDEALEIVQSAVSVIESFTGIKKEELGPLEWEETLNEAGFHLGHLPRNIWSAESHLEARNES